MAAPPLSQGDEGSKNAKSTSLKAKATQQNPSVLKESNLMGMYLEASLSGAIRGVAGLPIEHPFDCVKTKAQANLTASSPLEIMRETYRNAGLKGFYAGAVPNGIRIAFKQTYRWPMMLALPPFYDSILPEDTTSRFPSLKKTLTGGSIATLETFFITPLERLKVWLMTASRSDKTLGSFLRESKSHLGRELFKGLTAVYPRQIVTWVSFSVADEKFKSMARSYTGQKDLSFLPLMGVSFGVGLTNTAFVMPFDCIKTQFQMRSPLEKQGVMEAFRNTYNTFGVKGLYAGWQIKMIQYMIQSGFTVTLLEKLEQKWKK